MLANLDYVLLLLRKKRGITGKRPQKVNFYFKSDFDKVFCITSTFLTNFPTCVFQSDLT